MRCTKCGADQAAGGAFCRACGAPLTVSLTKRTTVSPEVAPPPPPPPDATGPLPELAWEPIPLSPGEAPDPWATDPGPPPPAPVRNRVPVLIAAGLVTLIGLAVAITLSLTGDDGVAAGGVSDPQGSASQSPTPSTAQDQPSTDPAPDPVPTAEPDPQPRHITVSATVEPCPGETGVFIGNDITSCPFAARVAKAYSAAAAARPDRAVTVRAYSPVTKKSYTMRCEYTTPVRCTGGTRALVYVDRSG